MFALASQSKAGGAATQSVITFARPIGAVASSQPRNEETQKNLSDKDTYGKGSHATEVTTSSAEFGRFLAVLVQCKPSRAIAVGLGDGSGPNQTSAPYSVSLHDENCGERDILDSSVVQSDRQMRKWRARYGAGYRKLSPSALGRALNELPVTLDATYERIEKTKREYAYRLRFFQCLAVARSVSKSPPRFLPF
ncbi:hypothetical protein EDB92DRAFT_1986957 [Lactarius akahatsu]|uniref:Uncharacterized protein n=1 Tax=Lactarius akahatsu TaxID=416441 RepID=A0AAD4LLH8_9AGAM|nr:hypothetical protein EDB92DRAFT_1986957 [Lactarius akahatsu]